MRSSTEREEGRNQLARLRDLNDLEVADDDPDVRGWSVVGGDGTTVGQVDDLIVDPDAMRARYLDVEMEGTDRRVLVPLQSATVDRDARTVSIPAAAADLRELPAYPPRITREFSREFDANWSARWGIAEPRESGGRLRTRRPE